MDKKKKKKGSDWKKKILPGVLFLFGIVLGVLAASYIDNRMQASSPFLIAFFFVLLLVFIYVAQAVETIIHEAGHLVCGLISGYKFGSFRVGNLMLIKVNGKLMFRKYSLAGTGGQCLMIPPEYSEDLPVVLYNLGGVLANLVSGVLFLVLAFVCNGILLLDFALFILGLLDLAFALVNGIPFQTVEVSNDGFNVLQLKNSSKARKALWIQFKMNEAIVNGTRLKDMPDSWFVMPIEADMQNGIIAALGVFACNRLMDEHRFQEAYEKMQKLMKMDAKISGVHRALLICDMIFCELILENRKEVIEELYTTEQMKFMTLMKDNLSVIRTKYAYSLVCDQDWEGPEKLLKDFERVAKNHPHQVDVQSEREFMEVAREVFLKRSVK